MTDDISKFLLTYKAIVVFGSYRYGSSALCDILANYVRDQGLPVSEWSEFLSLNKYVGHTSTGYEHRYMEHSTLKLGDTQLRGIDSRPIPAYLAKSKLEFFQKIKLDQFVVFKVSPNDFYDGNDELIQRYILDDPSIFKVGLNRSDVGNAIISYAIGVYFNFWNGGTEHTAHAMTRPVEKVKLDIELLEHKVKLIITHNNWLFYNHHKLDHVIWYDELPSLTVPKMGLHNYSNSNFIRNTLPHSDRLSKHFINNDEIEKFLTDLDVELAPLIREVSHVTRKTS